MVVLTTKYRHSSSRSSHYSKYLMLFSSVDHDDHYNETLPQFFHHVLVIGGRLPEGLVGRPA